MSDRLGAPTKRLLTLREAADYCGVSTGAFQNHCPVLPCVLEARVVRYDVRAIDGWIDRMSGYRMPSHDQILERLKT